MVIREERFVIHIRKVLKRLAFGVLYALSMSIPIAVAGTTMFSEFPSFFYLSLIALLPSMIIISLLIQNRVKKGLFVCLLYSIVAGFCIVFSSLLTSALAAEVLPSTERIADTSLFLPQNLVHPIYISVIGAILLIPVNFFWIRISHRLP